MSTNSRIQPPAVNLKDRIAALQQRTNNAVPNTRSTSPPPPLPISSLHSKHDSPNNASGGGLRDKIAKFEQKGGVPIPRGSFGLGAPPVPENGQPKRRGELYGNRIPAPLRSGILTPQVTGGTIASWSRSVSSPAGALTPQVTGGTFVSWSRSTTPYSRETSPTDPSWDTGFDSMAVGVEFPRETPSLSNTSSPGSPSLPFAALDLTAGTDDESALNSSPEEAVIDNATSSERFTEDTLLSHSTAEPITSPTKPVSPTPEEASAEERCSTTLTSAEDNLDSEPTVTVTSLSDSLNTQSSPVSPVDHDGLHEDANPPSTNLVKPALVPLEYPPRSPVAQASLLPVGFAEATTDDMSIANSMDETKGEDSPASRSSKHDSLQSDAGFVAQRDFRSRSPDPEPSAGEISTELTHSSNVFFSVDTPQVSSPAIAISLPPTSVGEGASGHLNVEVHSPDPPIARLAYDDTPSPTPTLTPYPGISSASSGQPTPLAYAAPPQGSSRPRSMIESATPEIGTSQRVVPPIEHTISKHTLASQVNTSILHKSSYSYSHTQSNPANLGFDIKENAISQIVKPATFSAVVHKKVTETTSSIAAPGGNLPETPAKRKRISHTTDPLSPGGGDLTRLVEEAALLEQLLLGGEIPSETSSEVGVTDDAPSLPQASSVAEMHSTNPVGVLDSRRVPEESDSLRVNPLSLKSALSRSKSAYGRLSTDSEQINSSKHLRTQSASPFPNEPQLSVSIPELEEVPPTPPPKSPNRFFPGMRTLGNHQSPPKKRPSHVMPGAYPRDSVSMSSEDSVAVITPPDNTLDFPGPAIGSTRHTIYTSSNLTVSEFGSMGAHVSRAGTIGPGSSPSNFKPWPSISPKKSKSFSRAASFAGKMFQRARTKSSGSTVSTSDEARRIAAESMMEPLPVPDRDSTTPSSLVHSGLHPPSSIHPASPDRPESWVSISSTNSSARTLDIFDAFPSVPQDPNFPSNYKVGTEPFSRPPIPFPVANGSNSWSTPP